jgi:hypothetical protein
VAAESIVERFNEYRLALLACDSQRFGCYRPGVDYIHAVALKAGDAEAFAFALKVGLGRVALE